MCNTMQMPMKNNSNAAKNKRKTEQHVGNLLYRNNINISIMLNSCCYNFYCFYCNFASRSHIHNIILT